jgi:hypothetical protein
MKRKKGRNLGGCGRTGRKPRVRKSKLCIDCQYAEKFSSGIENMHYCNNPRNSEKFGRILNSEVALPCPMFNRESS